MNIYNDMDVGDDNDMMTMLTDGLIKVCCAALLSSAWYENIALLQSMLFINRLRTMCFFD
jgi:hypothetical protein